MWVWYTRIIFDKTIDIFFTEPLPEPIYFNFLNRMAIGAAILLAETSYLWAGIQS